MSEHTNYRDYIEYLADQEAEDRPEQLYAVPPRELLAPIGSEVDLFPEDRFEEVPHATPAQVAAINAGSPFRVLWAALVDVNGKEKWKLTVDLSGLTVSFIHGDRNPDRDRRCRRIQEYLTTHSETPLLCIREGAKGGYNMLTTYRP